MERWDALDLDDSDLSSLLRPTPAIDHHRKRGPPSPQHQQHPPKLTIIPTSSQPLPRSLQHCSQIPRNTQNPNQSQPQNPPPLIHQQSHPPDRFIPGPAGVIQAAMKRRSSRQTNLNLPNDSSTLPQSVSHEEEDEDFKKNPWLCAMDFIRSDAKSPPPHPIKTIRSMDRVPQVVGIVNSCTPNGLGDLIVRLKDPTATIGANIHNKVIAERKFNGDISVGSVIVLRQVVAFSPARNSQYLNVTLNNVDRIFDKDCEPPSKQRFMCPGVANEEHLNVGLGIPVVSKGADGIGSVEVQRQANSCQGMLDEVEINGGDVCSSSGNAAVNEPTNHELCGNGKEIKRPMPRVSLPDWTDEQLQELFADCDDDINLLHPSGT